jgi:hypothetical protein
MKTTHLPPLNQQTLRWLTPRGKLTLNFTINHTCPKTCQNTCVEGCPSISAVLICRDNQA